MSWLISHGKSSSGGPLGPSYGGIRELAHHLSYVLPAHQWRELKPILDRRSGDPFTVPPAEAGRAAGLIRRGAAHCKFPADFRPLAHRIADAGDAAARAEDDWEWD